MSERTFPSGNAISFIVCETIRQEAYGKTALLGVYTGGEILVSDTAPPDIVLPLALYWSFEDGEGAFNWKARIVGPRGEEVVSHTGDPFVKPASINVTLALVFPFKPNGEGRYACEVSLDGRTYTRMFGYRRGKLPA